MRALSSSTSRAARLGGALVTAALLAGFAAGPTDPAGFAPLPAGPDPDPPTVVRVYVVWGSSNACGQGRESLSEHPEADLAREWWWRGNLDPAPLDDPFPCRKRTGTSNPFIPDSSKGSAWPAFADALLDADVLLDPPTGTGLRLFMSSLAQGFSLVGPYTPPGPNDDEGRVMQMLPPGPLDWHPRSENEHYDDGIATIAAAMDAARAEFPPDENGEPAVEFGGVVWNQGNDFNHEDPPWPEYRTALDTLLYAFSQDVLQGTEAGGPYPNARFYYVNAAASPSPEYPLAVSREYLDAEADVCAGFAFCSVVHASEHIREEYDACLELPDEDDHPACRAKYYNTENGLTDGHWAQVALNHVGHETAAVVLAHAALLEDEPDPFTWEVAVEVTRPADYCDPEVECFPDFPDLPEAPPIRLDVYDDAGDLITAASGVIAPSIRNPDWTADFDGGDADWEADWTTLSASTDFLTFEFWREASTGPDELLGRYVYVPTALDDGADPFYRPTGTAGPAAVRFEVYVEDPISAALAVRAGPGPGVGPLAAPLGPFFEAALGRSYVLPYNAACAGAGATCPAETPGYFLARLPVNPNAPEADRPDDASRPFTFSPTVDARIPASWGSVAWGVDGARELRFPEGRRLRVGGTLTATDEEFVADEVAEGWGGLRFEAGSTGTLSGVLVEGVRRPAASAGLPGLAAVEVLGGAEVEITDQSEIRGGVDVHGVWAWGTGTLVTLDGESVVQDMALVGSSATLGGIGVVAAAGAEARVYGGTTIQLNGSTGVAATGSGSLLRLAESDVLTNTGYGVASQSSGEVAFGRHDDPTPAVTVDVNANVLGGLYALTSSEVTAGQIDGVLCTAACQNNILNHGDDVQGSGPFDVKAQGSGSVVLAEYNFWGDNRPLSDLELVASGGGMYDVTPLWNGQALRPGGAPAGALASALAGGSLSSLLGGDSTVVGDSAVALLVEAAYAARAVGDTTAASAALLLALPLALTPEEVGLAFGTTGRFLAHGGDPALEAYLATRTAPEDESRPWALAALLAADAAEGRTEAAWERAGTLASEYAGSDHALMGLGMTARLAFEGGDLASVEGALAGLVAGWPELLETEAAGALVRWMHEADSLVAGVGGQAGTSADGPEPAVSRAAKALPGAFRLLAPRPNPFANRIAVPFEVGGPTRVRLAVYDVLGREVAVLADGPVEPGRYEAVFDGRGLAPGLYLVRARVEPEAGSRRSYLQRITLVR